MTDGPNRIFDEFAKLMTDAAGAAQGMRKEAETAFRSQAERLLHSMDLAKRDDFDAVREMAAKARDENDALEKRLADLDARIAKLEGGAAPKAAAKKPASGKSAS